MIRTYDSRDKRIGDFGAGWNLSLRDIRIEKTGVTGIGWEETSTGGAFPTFSLHPLKARKVTVTFPDGRVFKFQATANPATQQFVPIQGGTISYVQVPGTSGTAGAALEIAGSSQFLVDGAVPGGVNLFSTSGADVANPTRFRLTTAEGFVYLVDQSMGLQSVTEPNGNAITITPGGIIHSNRASVTFTRDALSGVPYDFC